MKTALLITLLFLPLSGAFAQTCNSTTHFDNQVPQHVCTNVTATGNGLPYTIISEDGIQEGPNYTWPGLPMEFNATYSGNNAQATLSIPLDPLLLSNPYHYTQSVLNTNWTVFPAYTQITQWSGAVGASDYYLTTITSASLYEPVDSGTSAGQSWVGVFRQFVQFGGCSGSGRYRHCKWTFNTAYGEFSSTATALP